MVQAWEPLSRVEYDAVWDRVYREFAFRPSVDAASFPGIREPVPSITWTLQRAPWTLQSEEELHRQFLAAFQTCTMAEEAIYALDWQHSCYWLRPHVPFEEWAVPVLPNGDYFIFLSRDFTWGVFGHPWEWTMCSFGKLLLDALAAAGLPHMLASVVRTTYREELSRLYGTSAPNARLFGHISSFQICPLCIRDMQHLSRDLALPAMRYCPVHRVALRNRCDCGDSLCLFPSSLSAPFVCGSCGRGHGVN